MALEAVTEWIQERYPKPKLDPVSPLPFDMEASCTQLTPVHETPPSTHHDDGFHDSNPIQKTTKQEWTTACFHFLRAELQLDPATQLNELIQHVHLQLLQSDLCDSMVRQTGFPAGLQVQDGMRKGTIGTRATGGPILVQIVGMMEVGSSAFTLSNIRQARLDKADLTGLTKDHEEQGGGGGEDGVTAGARPTQANGVENEEEDATMPPYPRSMLSLRLSDGTVTIKAMEKKRIDGLVLGETPLGFKVNEMKCLPLYRYSLSPLLHPQAPAKTRTDPEWYRDARTKQRRADWLSKRRAAGTSRFSFLE